MVASKRQTNSNRQGQQQEDTPQRKKQQQQHGSHSSRSKQKKKSEQQQQPTALTQAFGDLCVTALWVLCSSVFAEGADWLSSKTQLGPFTTGTTITIVALVAFAPICNLFWGAIFNPVHNAALLVCGRGQFFRNALRMAGQLLGALLGSLAAVTLIPEQYQGKFLLNSGGLRDGIHIGLGFVCEAGLGLAVNMLFLYSIVAKNRTLAFWTPLGATVLLGWVGSYFTGPSLNPVVSFCWYWRYQQHSRAEHLLVFWAAPFCGALLAGLAFRWYEKRSSKAGRAAAKKSK